MFRRPKSASKMAFRLEPDGEVREVSFSPGASVLDTALENEIPISTSCGGMGTCGTCRVWVESAPADLESRNEIEREMALDREFDAAERLACQTSAREGLVVRVPPVDESD